MGGLEAILIVAAATAIVLLRRVLLRTSVKDYETGGWAVGF
jgi:hypothetical protein